MNDGLNTSGSDGTTRDEAFDRLVAADPAAGAEPRAGVLRAKVDDLRVAEDGRGVDELSERRASRRRRASWLVAAGVAGAVAIGGGGYTLGLASGGGSESVADSGPSAAPAIPLGVGRAGEGAESGGATEGGMSDAAEGAAAGDPAAGSAAESSGATDIAYPGWYSGRALFSADGLGTAAGEAEAYSLDARDVTTEAAVGRLAQELGVEGEPKWGYGSWTVGSADGTGKSLTVSVDGSAYVNYSDPAADPWRCEGGQAEGECPTPTTSEVSDGDARKALRRLLTRLGVDVESFQIEVQPASEGDPARWVVAHQVVAGSRTGVTFSATVGESGIAWADGALARPTSIGRYPVVSETEAVERLGDPRFAQSVYPIAIAEPERFDAPADPGPGKPSPAPAPPSSGSPITWPVSEVTITEARLGLAQHQQEDGATLLVPAYELRDDEGNAWSVIAVADDALDFSS